jgi:hypothetical protein
MNPNDPPYNVETWGKFFAEYRRMLDSHGEEHLGVTLWHPDDEVGERKFHIEMDALERFASKEMPKCFFAKPLDESKPDSLERFREYTAAFHAGTSPKGGEILALHLTYAKEKEGERLEQEMWIPQQAVKEFSALGIEYEKELGLTKRWYPVVRVVGLGEPKGSIWVVRTQASVEDKDGARERVQRRADRSREDVLWEHPFRRRFEVGDEFSVRLSEGTYGNGKLERRMVSVALADDVRRLQEMFPGEIRKWPVRGL